MKQYFLFLIIVFFSCNDNDYKYKKNQLLFNQTKNSNKIKNIRSNKLINGEKIFNGSCATCHLYGSGGSILINDKEMWKNIISKKSIDTIYKNVINGLQGKNGYMPKRGGCISCSDQDLINSVNYIFSINRIDINN